ncbi:Type I restriction-modification system, specificity subunit S [uncultured Gammaproteobacteria bacterium]|nr:Type I restriction-modification system, specificity subunit S [uncultured Gammaproteobacteria bacterium]
MCKYKHLPKGWKVKKLGEISNIKTGKSNAVDADINGKYAFFDRSKKIKKSNRFLFDCESLIIPGEGAQFFPRYYSGKFDLHQRVYVIFNFHNSVHIRFVEYYLIFSHKHFEEVAVGATVKSLRLRHFTEIQIPFPSLSKQKFIVVTLNKTFAKITKAETIAKTNLQNAKELFESYLQGVLSDKRWTIVKLNNVCEKVEYGSSSKSLAVGELPVLRMGNIQDGRLAWNDLKFSNNKEDNKKYILKHNDVLFNRTNSPEWVGKTAIYKSEMPAIFAGYLIRIHRKKDLLDADYLNYYLNS